MACEQAALAATQDMGQIRAGLLTSTAELKGLVKDSTDGEGLGGWSMASRWTRIQWVVNQFSGNEEDENHIPIFL